MGCRLWGLTGSDTTDAIAAASAAALEEHVYFLWFVVAAEKKYVLCYVDFRKFQGNTDGILHVPGRTQEGSGLKDDEKFLKQL